VLLVARPAALLLSLARTGLPRPQKLFMAWFGPKGVTSMLFALFVLKSGAPDRSVVFDAAAFVILASIAAHGLTDTVAARWIERRMREWHVGRREIRATVETWLKMAPCPSLGGARRGMSMMWPAAG
jgi:NhaP-type Na+/H+ and K+/H+ antiporter